MIDTRDLFQELNASFLEDLQRIPPGQWDNRTCYPSWRVRDIMAHLIQTALGRLSRQRDHYPNGLSPPEMEFTLLSELIKGSNEAWVDCMKGISPELLFTLFRITEQQLSDFMKTQELGGDPFFPVSWADRRIQQNWMDIGREYTERWHHQQQIREALNLPLRNEKRFLKPVIDLTVLSLPRWYEDLDTETGSCLEIVINGSSGGIWYLLKRDRIWVLKRSGPEEIQGRVEMTEDLFWRFMMRCCSPGEAEKEMTFSGSPALCNNFLRARSVMIND